MYKILSVNSKILILLIEIISITLITASVEDNWTIPQFNVLQKIYDDCQDKNDFSGCLKGKALLALGKAIEQDSITLSDGIILTKQNQTDIKNTPSITNARSLNELNGIDKELMLKLDTFLRTHVVKIDMNDDNEGRSKKEKKLGSYAIAAFLTAMGIAAPIGLKALGVIAGKALILSKVALTIAGMIAIKKLFKSEHREEIEVHSKEHSNRRNGYYKRTASMKHYSPTHSITDPYRYYYDKSL